MATTATTANTATTATATATTANTATATATATAPWATAPMAPSMPMATTATATIPTAQPQVMQAAPGHAGMAVPSTTTGNNAIASGVLAPTTSQTPMALAAVHPQPTTKLAAHSLVGGWGSQGMGGTSSSASGASTGTGLPVANTLAGAPSMGSTGPASKQMAKEIGMSGLARGNVKYDHEGEPLKKAKDDYKVKLAQRAKDAKKKKWRREDKENRA
ncbi:hypothetical protein BGZ74_011526 [Mortierella antarctica]|nr:hypothetical protein BGZ74_011526 [Mortierella antarctica]